ncbi:MAG TPA: alpha/beta hydrolase domain-containing protein, partial [Vicinamibacterales bacterium]|nr:alpha/beta hydrolase domain-containing protein [Vicinamibacterales bacterium]
MRKRCLRLLVAIVALVAPASPARAEVTRVEIRTRADIGASGFEKIVGTAHFEVDPRDPRNRMIADIDKAPVNAAGRVEFSSDLYIIRPKDAARSNGITLVDVLNRGRKPVMNGFIRNGAIDPGSDADLGDRFLLDHGFSLVWVGWEFDVRRQNGLMGISVPSAHGVNAPVWGDFTPANGNERQTVGDLAGYTPADPAAPDNRLTVRDSQFGREEAIDRSTWMLDGNVVILKGGFQAGRIYRVSYHAKELPISGLGLAAFRDIGSWVKHASDAAVHTTQALAFGSSQSGRFLRTFLYNGFNGDEKGRQVYDAAWMHIAGAAGLDVNARGATPTSLTMYEITRFPYANQATRDPVSGRTDGLLENDRARAFQPKTFFTNTSVEYWGGGRSAALVHTAPDGKSDLTLADNTRVYYLTGAQHGPARFPTTIGQGQQPDNPLEYWWTMRALMSAMEKWMRDGTAPPPSQYPKLSDGTLVAASAVAFPSIPGVQTPAIVEQHRRDGRLIPVLVPQVDADGNERAGIRTPESLVALATYTGWNFRNKEIGGSTQLVSLLGSRIPFARTPGDAAAAGDPRKSIAER